MGLFMTKNDEVNSRASGDIFNIFSVIAKFYFNNNYKKYDWWICYSILNFAIIYGKFLLIQCDFICRIPIHSVLQGGYLSLTIAVFPSHDPTIMITDHHGYTFNNQQQWYSLKASHPTLDVRVIKAVAVNHVKIFETKNNIKTFCLIQRRGRRRRSRRKFFSWLLQFFTKLRFVKMPHVFSIM